MFQVGIYVNLYVFSLITYEMILAGLILASAGYTFGGLLAWVCGLPLDPSRAPPALDLVIDIDVRRILHRFVCSVK